MPRRHQKRSELLDEHADENFDLRKEDRYLESLYVKECSCRLDYSLMTDKFIHSELRLQEFVLVVFVKIPMSLIFLSFR